MTKFYVTENKCVLLHEKVICLPKLSCKREVWHQRCCIIKPTVIHVHLYVSPEDLISQQNINTIFICKQMNIILKKKKY